MTGVVEVLATVGSAAASAAPYVTAGLSLASAGLQIASAQRQASALRTQAAQSSFAADQELLRGREQAVQIQRQLAAVRAAQNARYAAAGVLLDDGTPETVTAATEAEAERQTTIARSNAVIAAESQRIRGGMLEDQADAAASTGWWQAGFGLFDLVDRSAQRAPGVVRRPTATAAQLDARLGALY